MHQNFKLLHQSDKILKLTIKSLLHAFHQSTIYFQHYKKIRIKYVLIIAKIIHFTHLTSHIILTVTDQTQKTQFLIPSTFLKNPLKYHNFQLIKPRQKYYRFVVSLQSFQSNLTLIVSVMNPIINENQIIYHIIKCIKTQQFIQKLSNNIIKNVIQQQKNNNSLNTNSIIREWLLGNRGITFSCDDISNNCNISIDEVNKIISKMEQDGLIASLGNKEYIFFE